MAVTAGAVPPPAGLNPQLSRALMMYERLPDSLGSSCPALDVPSLSTCRGTSLISSSAPLGPYSWTISRALW